MTTSHRYPSFNKESRQVQAESHFEKSLVVFFALKLVMHDIPFLYNSLSFFCDHQQDSVPKNYFFSTTNVHPKLYHYRGHTPDNEMAKYWELHFCNFLNHLIVSYLNFGCG